jgi:hypothetical protein
MQNVNDWHTLLALGLAIAGCRYRYELLPSRADESTAGTAGAASLGGATASAGAHDGGAPDAGVGESGFGGDSGGVGAPGGAAGDAGSTGGIPPDLALCTQASYGGHEYLLCEEPRSWDDAKGGCVAVGMQLARVDDANENDWLYANIRNGSAAEVWLGATDQAVEGEWRWSDGDGFWLGDNAGTAQNGLFSGWYFREPNNVGEEDCAALEAQSANPEWYDRQCHIALSYVCESL